MMVYGLLGTVQAMGYLYFIVTLTTIEKRFKIPSQTTGTCDPSARENNRKRKTVTLEFRYQPVCTHDTAVFNQKLNSVSKLISYH